MNQHRGGEGASNVSYLQCHRYLFNEKITTKLTGGNESQRKCRPV
ncbi:MAG TPA: hypothetical protein ACFYD4_13830 [Candidatus Wunengus sp. YC61]